jgi:hypothetical protein
VLQGIALFILAYGFFLGKDWAWILGIVFGVWDFILGVLGLPGGLIRIIYAVIILYYLMRPNVKAFFRQDCFSHAPMISTSKLR